MAKLPIAFNANEHPLDPPKPSPVPLTPAPVSPPSTDPWDNWGTHPHSPSTGETFTYKTVSGETISLPINMDADGNPIRSRVMTSHLENGIPVIDHIPDGFTDEEASILREWFPKLWNKPSPHVTNSHGVVINEEDVLKHVAAEMKVRVKEERQERKRQREADAEADAQYAIAYQNWVEACQARKARIEACYSEWRKRVSERDAALKQWDEYVREARDAVQEGKLEPVPPRPEK